MTESQKIAPLDFAKDRAAAILDYTENRKSGWKVLGFGTAQRGRIGAVYVEDAAGERGFIVQDHIGASVGAVVSQRLIQDYVPVESF